MMKIYSTLVLLALTSPALASGNSCDGAFSIDTLPACEATNVGLACGLGDGESFQIYVCKADGWHAAQPPRQ